MCRRFAPVVDGEGGFLPDTPGRLRFDEEFNQVPEMIGFTQEDAYLYLLGRESPLPKYSGKSKILALVLVILCI